MAYKYFKKTYGDKLLYILRTSEKTLMDAYGPGTFKWEHSRVDYVDRMMGQDYDAEEITKEEALKIVQNWDREWSRAITQSLD